MTSIDLLLSFARITTVGFLAIFAGYCLLRRRPDIVPGLSLAGLLSGCVLLAASGTEWPTLWESSISVTNPVPPSDSGGQNSPFTTKPLSNFGISLTDAGRFVRKLDVVDSGTASMKRLNLLTVFGVMVALAIARILAGLISTVCFHQRSMVINSDRLRKLLSVFAGHVEDGYALEFRVSRQIHVPCVTAISQRCIYLPENWNDFSADELGAAITHELGHLNRQDARWRLLAQLATALQVFHPLSHGLLRQLVLAQELSADQWAADAIGQSRFVRGISQLALRLDHAALPRRSKGIGMSHSSSFLIRRIKMLRNGMPAHRRKTHWLTRKFAALSIFAIAFVASSWTLSAEEPDRVAARIIDPLTEKQPEIDTDLWNILPGRTGYWSLNFQAALKHQLIGEWLNQADAGFITPGWMMIAKDEARGQRGRLGLSLRNLATLSGTVMMETKRIEDDDSEKTFRTKVTTSEMILRMRKDVDWSSIAAALPKERLDSAIRILIGPQISADVAEQLIQLDLIDNFFSKQTDPRRFIFKQDPEKPETTAPVIKSLWNEYSGKIATMIVKLPLFSGQTESEMATLMQNLHEAGEYEVVGVDPSVEPEKIRMTIGLTVREGKSTEQLLAAMSAVINASIKEFDANHANDEPLDASEEAIFQFLKTVKPEIRKSSNPAKPSAVILEGDVMPTALWLAIGG